MTLHGPKKRRFEQIYTSGDRTAGRICRVHHLPGSGLVGVAVSRALGCAAQRNRQARRVRAIAGALGLSDTEWDWVLFVRSTAAHATYDELCEELTRLTEEAKSRARGKSQSE